MKYHRVASLKTADAFCGYLSQIGIDLPFDKKMVTDPDAPMAQSYRLKNGFTIGNRFCILPMAGRDGTTDGCPTELTIRRWRRFGMSGAKLIWGGEEVAVRPDGRTNPNQLMINEDTFSDLAVLREALMEAHKAHCGPG